MRPPPPPAPVRKTNIGLSISNVTLQNGLRVVLVRDPKAREIQVTMRYAVGAADDPAGQAGIAHLVEHLMFQQVIGAQSIFTKLKSTARVFNATTTVDATTYSASAPADRIDALMAIEAVRMNLRCTSITESVFAREREVVVNEVRMRDQGSELREAFTRGVFPESHPYTARVAGTVESVGALTMKQACAFADAHYGPSNAVLVVSGNIENAALEASLAKFLARIPKRAVVASKGIQAPTQVRAVETSAPIDDDAVLVAWPIPPQPDLRAKLWAIGGSTMAYVDAMVGGQVTPLMLGGARAEMFALVIERGQGETTEEIIEAVETATKEAPDVFRARGILGSILFHRIQQGAIHQAFAGLEEGSDRDERLAAHVMAGRAADAVIGSELQSLHAMSREEARELARTYFAYDRANIVVLKASEQTRGAAKLALAAPVHDIGQRRDPPDPEEANVPATEPLATREPEGMTTRTLANGMRVILLPMTSVPTVDIRIVFGAGTADEEADKRGAAIVAAQGLQFSLRHINDELNLALAGAEVIAHVGDDFVGFKTRGLDMHVDYLLAGLRRLVRDGFYNREAGAVVEAMREQAKTNDDEGALTDTWRLAMFGANHPYTRAGLARHASPALTLDDAQKFRAAHFTPANATLVIAGRFDPAVADKWVDYLFADWTGTAAKRRVTPTQATALSVMKAEDIAQVQLHVTLPALGGARAERLIAAEMLSSIALDVRHQLGAAYVLTAELGERRQASWYSIGGAIDAPRTHEAIALIKARVEQLRTDKEAAARAFVVARRRVLSQLTSTTGAASSLGDRVMIDVSLERPPLSDVKLASEIHDLTIAAMSVALADLDLSRAAIFMRGPKADVDRAFGVLGRTASGVVIGDDESPFVTATETKLPDEERVYAAEIEDALTLQQQARSLTFGAAGGYVAGQVLARSFSGIGVSAHAGMRLDDTKTAGVRLSLATGSGTYNASVGLALPVYKDIEVTSVSATAFLSAVAMDRFHGDVFVGMSFDRTIDDAAVVTEPTWSKGVNLGLQGSFDVLKLDQNRVSVFVRAETEILSSAEYRGFGLGLGYRRF